MRHGALATIMLVGSLLVTGCGGSTAQPQVVDKVRAEVATVLGKEPAQVNISKPLVKQGADELDIVEIVMAVEEAFKVEIPDSAIGEKIGEVSKTLTVEKLADIVAQQQKKR